MRDRRARVLFVMLLASVPIVLFAIGWLAGLRINLTPSYPLGLWRIIPLDREVAAGDLIFVCPPETPAFRLALERGYVRPGLCSGWMTPLIKTVVALPGQEVVIAGSVTIDGVLLARSQVRAFDAEGRALSAYSGGIVPPAHLFLHSDFSGSYDSRYFGPMPASGVLGLAWPLLTFTP